MRTSRPLTTTLISEQVNIKVIFILVQIVYVDTHFSAKYLFTSAEKRVNLCPCKPTCKVCLEFIASLTVAGPKVAGMCKT
jgi:hypothetical protein